MERQELYAYLPTLQALLELEEEDSRLIFAMEASLAQILSYLCAETLPKELLHAWLIITAGQWKDGGYSAETPLTSLSRGDVTWDYATLAQRNSDGFYGQRNLLNAHRKVRCFHGKSNGRPG